jgi:multicomponent Na+:H+ antiporter subunit G
VVRLVAVLALGAFGLFFSLSGTVGIVRMPDVYCRVQCAGKTVVCGALPALAALVVGMGPVTNYGGRALLVAFLLLVLGPLASHALSRAAYRVGVPMWSGSVVDQAAEDRAAEDQAAEDRAAEDRAEGRASAGER